MKNFLILIISISLFSGCATVGTQIQPTQLTKIKEGVTTEKEVVAILGTPQMKTLDSNGKTLMTYQYVKVKNRAENFIPIVNILSTSMDMNQQMLTVLLDKNGIVEKYSMNNSDSTVRSGLLNQ